MTYGRNLAGLMAKMLNENSSLQKPTTGGAFRISVNGPTSYQEYRVMAEFNEQRKRWEILEVQ